MKFNDSIIQEIYDLYKNVFKNKYYFSYITIGYAINCYFNVEHKNEYILINNKDLKVINIPKNTRYEYHSISIANDELIKLLCKELEIIKSKALYEKDFKCYGCKHKIIYNNDYKAECLLCTFDELLNNNKISIIKREK